MSTKKIYLSMIGVDFILSVFICFLFVCGNPFATIFIVFLAFLGAVISGFLGFGFISSDNNSLGYALLVNALIFPVLLVSWGVFFFNCIVDDLFI